MRALSRALWSLPAALAVLVGLTGLCAAQQGQPKKLLFFSLQKGEKKGACRIYTMNFDGSGRTAVSKGDVLAFDPAWSPDGKRIAFVAAQDESVKKTDLYVMNADGSGRKWLTENKPDVLALSPCWSPDGKRIFFVQIDPRKREGRIFVIGADGKDQKLVADVGGMMPAVSPDGKQILYTGQIPKDATLSVMNVDGTGRRKIRGAAMMGCWSPDGKKIAFLADNLYVADADGSNAVRLTKTKDLKFTPQWSPDGKRIFFTRLGNGLRGQGIYVIDRDGKNEKRLTRGDARDFLGGGIVLANPSVDIPDASEFEKGKEPAGK